MVFEISLDMQLFLFTCGFKKDTFILHLPKFVKINFILFFMYCTAVFQNDVMGLDNINFKNCPCFTRLI